MLSGIYYIINIINRKRYIGYTSNINKRYDGKHTIRRNWSIHHNILLSRAARKYGNENFKLVFVEECAEELLAEREIYHYNMFPKNMLYNVAAPGKGGNLGPVVNKKISISTKAAKARPEVKAAQSARQRGKKYSAERIEKIRISNTGKRHTEEAKEKIGVFNTGKFVSQETKEKQSRSLKAYNNNPEVRLRKSISATGEKNGIAKLKEVDVLNIRGLYNEGGATINDITNMYNVSRKSIVNVIKRSTWKHI